MNTEIRKEIIQICFYIETEKGEWNHGIFNKFWKYFAVIISLFQNLSRDSVCGSISKRNLIKVLRPHRVKQTV